MLVVTDTSTQPFPDQSTVVTIGAYDGLHLGHQAVIAQVRAIAAERHAKSAVVTFDRHPATVVRPESAPKLLTDHEQRLELFEQTGIDAAVVLPFDEHQAQGVAARLRRACCSSACAPSASWSATTSTSVAIARATSPCCASTARRTGSRSNRSTCWRAPTGSTSR